MDVYIYICMYTKNIHYTCIYHTCMHIPKIPWKRTNTSTSKLAILKFPNGKDWSHNRYCFRRAYKRIRQLTKKNHQNISYLFILTIKDLRFLFLVIFSMKMTSQIVCKKLSEEMKFHKLCIVFPIGSEYNIKDAVNKLTLMITGFMELV